MLCLGVVGFFGLDDARAEEAESAARVSERVSEQRRRGEELRAEVEKLKEGLAKAKTAEEKRTLIEGFRAKSEALRPRLPQEVEKRSTKERINDLKARAGNNPEMKARTERMAARLQAVEEMKETLQAAGKAQGAEKEKLLKDVARQRQTLTAMNEAEMAQRQALARTQSAAGETRELPPEMAAMRAKSEERKREIEHLKEVLAKGTAEEKRDELENFREKREQEMAERKARVAP